MFKFLTDGVEVYAVENRFAEMFANGVCWETTREAYIDRQVEKGYDREEIEILIGDEQ